MLTLPAIHRLVEANVSAATVLHSPPPMRRLFEVLFPAAQVVTSRRRASPVTMAYRLCRHGGRFAVGITFRHASRSKLMLRLAARHTLGSASGGGHLVLSERFPVDRDRHQVFDTDPILRGMGLPGVDPLWRPQLPASLVSEGERQLRRVGVWGRRLIGLAPAAAWGRSKRWPPASYGQLARALQREDLQPVVFIGPDEEGVAEEVIDSAGIELPVVGAEEDVAGLAGAMAHLALLVCNDSGPMHVGAMVGVPVVSLFGPTDPRRTAPLGDGHVVLSRGLECAPCLEPVCPLGHNECLRGLSFEPVLEAVAMVSRRGGRRGQPPGPP